MTDPIDRSHDSSMDSDDLYRKLVEASQDIIFVIDKQGYVCYVNNTAATFFGALPKEIQGKHLKELFPADAYELQSRALQHVFDSGEPFCKEEDKSFAERKIWLETRLIPIRSRNNAINHVMGVTRDITDLKHSQEVLRETTDKLDAILKASPAAIITLDPEGIVTHWNIAAEQIFGWSSQEVIGKPYPVVPDDKREEHRALHERSFRGESLIGVEVQRRKKDGTLVDINISVAPLHNRFGEIYGTVAVINDITERKRAEDLLKDALSRLKATLESTVDGILVVDNQGRISEFNEQFIRMWHIPQLLLDQHDDQKALDFVLDQLKDPDGFIARVKDLYAKPEEVSFDVLEFKDGRVFERLSRPQKIDGHPVGRVWSFRDVTERKQAEMELEKHRTHLEELVAQRTKEISLLNDQLRQSQKLEAVGILAGGIAHEFSNILATMKGSVYLIQKKLPEGSPVMKYAEQVLVSMKKANALSQGLLTFSRKQKILLKPLHLNEIIRSVGKMLAQLIGEEIEVAMNLTDRDTTVMADVNQIEQVLVNLATNAKDAMLEGGILTIGTDIMKIDEDFKKLHGFGVPGEYIVLTVADNGTGIEEVIREKIFEPFFTTKVVGKGSGLGLAVTYGIVKQHNGFIGVESVPGEGSTFKIYLPKVEAEVIKPIGLERTPTIEGMGTVLLAEDDDDARAIMGEMLKMTGYRVLEARNGEEAIRVFMANKDRVQLVFLDVRMPKKNGMEVYDEIKKGYPGTKFLFMSGYTADIMDFDGVSKGEINFISKAALPEEILSKIRDVLDQ